MLVFNEIYGDNKIIYMFLLFECKFRFLMKYKKFVVSWFICRRNIVFKGIWFKLYILVVFG